jgi:hypothetical protein
MLVCLPVGHTAHTVAAKELEYLPEGHMVQEVMPEVVP